MEHIFNVGDRVRLIVDSPDGNDDLMAGAEGTVECYGYEGTLGVRWDEFHSSLHSLDGNIDSGYGWYVFEDDVEPADAPEIGDLPDPGSLFE